MGRARQLASRPAAWVAAAVVVVVAGVALALTEPWTLFIDERVDEAFPTVVDTDAGDPDGGAGAGATTVPAGGPGGDATAQAPAGPVTLSTGTFQGTSRYDTSGTALALQLQDGSRFVRFEGFETSNGPDLRVYLSTAAVGASNDEVASDPEVVELGGLKGNIGDQNYEVPADVDLSRYRSVVIWCERFTTAFGSAEVAVTDT